MRSFFYIKKVHIRLDFYCRSITNENIWSLFSARSAAHEKERLCPHFSFQKVLVAFAGIGTRLHSLTK